MTVKSFTETIKYQAFSAKIGQTSTGWAILDYDCEFSFDGSLPLADSYDSQTETIAAFKNSVDLYASYYACQEKDRGYVWFEQNVGMWNESQMWGASTSCTPTAKAKILTWDEVQKFSAKQRYARIG